MRKGIIFLFLLLVGCKNVTPTPELIATAVPYITSTEGVVSTEILISTEIPTVIPTSQPTLELISQYGTYENACASASVLMVAQYYGVAGDETVEDIANEMAGGDYPVDFRLLATFIEDHYGLKTWIVTTYEPIIPMLENAGYDISDIAFVHGVPMETPVIWIYLTVPHWVVRYEGMNYDPSIGVFNFEETENIYRPESGLGIIVTK